jgi:molybdopterin molybdotransferase
MKPLTLAIRALDAYDPDALPVADALRIIRGCVTPVPMIERVALRSALGRVLAEDIVSPFDVPAHDNTAMDGWAVRHADLAAEGETVLRQVGEAFAGHPYTGAVGAGECVRVMTGAVLPTGTDCVVVQEVVRADSRGVCVPPGQRAGQHLRYRGEDLARGKPCVDAGCVLGPAHIGLLASLGLPEVPVRRRLRVAFFSTGDELVSIGEPLAPGAIYDSNRYTLHGMLTRLGCEVHDLGVVRDDPAALEAALASAAADADVVITTGGVSVGEADFTRAILARLGEAAFWKIAMRPGRPLAFGRVGHALFFGLPGNPVAVMITFYQFVREALLAAAGVSHGSELPMLRVPARDAIRKKPGRTEYQRAIVEQDAQGQWSVRLTGQQGSGVLSSMARANCLIVLEHGRGSVAAGEPVSVVLFEGLV